MSFGSMTQRTQAEIELETSPSWLGFIGLKGAMQLPEEEL